MFRSLSLWTNQISSPAVKVSWSQFLIEQSQLGLANLVGYFITAVCQEGSTQIQTQTLVKKLHYLVLAPQTSGWRVGF